MFYYCIRLKVEMEGKGLHNTCMYIYFLSGCLGNCTQHLNLQQFGTYQCQLNFNHTKKSTLP